jgi:hypothetical protein
MPPDHVRRLLAATFADLKAGDPARADQIRMSKVRNSIARFEPGCERGTLLCLVEYGANEITYTTFADSEDGPPAPSVNPCAYDGFANARHGATPVFQIGDRAKTAYGYGRAYTGTVTKITSFEHPAGWFHRMWVASDAGRSTMVGPEYGFEPMPAPPARSGS